MENRKLIQSAKLISVTPDAEKTIARSARVSNPSNENSEEYRRLFTHCLLNGHWSIFEQADMAIEIITARCISHQMIRHWSFNPQELSQRYVDITTVGDYSGYVEFEARSQDKKNRQNSINDMDNDTKTWFNRAQESVFHNSIELYKKAIDKGIAKEQARVLLPLNTATRIIWKGNVRSWIFYLRLRSKEHGTQKEHVEIAEKCKKIFCEEFPIISDILSFNKTGKNKFDIYFKEMKQTIKKLKEQNFSDNEIKEILFKE